MEFKHHINTFALFNPTEVSFEVHNDSDEPVEVQILAGVRSAPRLGEKLFYVKDSLMYIEPGSYLTFYKKGMIFAECFRINATSPHVRVEEFKAV